MIAVLTILFLPLMKGYGLNWFLLGAVWTMCSEMKCENIFTASRTQVAPDTPFSSPWLSLHSSFRWGLHPLHHALRRACHRSQHLWDLAICRFWDDVQGVCRVWVTEVCNGGGVSRPPCPQEGADWEEHGPRSEWGPATQMSQSSCDSGTLFV